MSNDQWNREDHLHHPFYCEENVWHLLRSLDVERAQAVFITARPGPVWMQAQRAAPSGSTIGWDYHVVALIADPSPRIFDLDSRLAFPCSLRAYLAASFPPRAPDSGCPWFRTVEASAFLAAFRSDRRHMKRPDGSWIHAPPPWAPISRTGSDLSAILDFEGPAPLPCSAWLDAVAFGSRWSP